MLHDVTHITVIRWERLTGILKWSVSFHFDTLKVQPGALSPFAAPLNIDIPNMAGLTTKLNCRCRGVLPLPIEMHLPSSKPKIGEYLWRLSKFPKASPNSCYGKTKLPTVDPDPGRPSLNTSPLARYPQQRPREVSTDHKSGSLEHQDSSHFRIALWLEGDEISLCNYRMSRYVQMMVIDVVAHKHWHVCKKVDMSVRKVNHHELFSHLLSALGSVSSIDLLILDAFHFSASSHHISSISLFSIQIGVILHVSPLFNTKKRAKTQRHMAHYGDNLQPGIIWDLTRRWSLSFFTCEDVKCLVMFSRRWATCEEDTPQFYRCQRDLMYLKE